MKIKCIFCSKTNESYWIEAIKYYEKKLKNYVSIEIIELNDLKNTKNMDQKTIRQKEGELILGKITATDKVILLDDKGKEYTSMQLSEFINQLQIQSTKSLVFVVGGAYGFSPEVYQRAASQLSLSKLTFSHQMVRVIFLEQLYRAYAIIHNEPYHHE
ncbi:MAG: 23S rRNA (pseudouridine(1915)-N(3))-methyltransferase RlmH [Bacteroidota bacterium]